MKSDLRALHFLINDASAWTPIGLVFASGTPIVQGEGGHPAHPPRGNQRLGISYIKSSQASHLHRIQCFSIGGYGGCVLSSGLVGNQGAYFKVDAFGSW